MTNPAMSQGGGAGIQAAQFVVSQGAQVVLTGNLGPNAYDVLQAAGVPGYLAAEGTVRQAIDAYLAGKLQPMAGASVAPHSGMVGGGRGTGAGRGAQPAAASAARRAELDALQDKLRVLRQELAETMERIDKLEP